MPTRTVLSSLAAHIAVLDRMGNIVATNRAWDRFACLNGAVALDTCGVGANYQSVCRAAAEQGDADAQAVLTGIGAVLDGTAASFTRVYPCFAPDKHWWFELSATPLAGGRGGAVIAHSDVTERHYRQVDEHAPLGLALQAPDGRYLQVNPALCALVGYSEDELLARTCRDITHPDDLDASLEHMRRILAGETISYQAEQRYVCQDLRPVWVLLSVSLVRGEDGKPAYVIVQAQDISARKEIEWALTRGREAAEELASLRQAQAAEAEALAAVSATLASTLEPEQLYALMLDHVSRVLPYDHATVLIQQDGWATVAGSLGGITLPLGMRTVRETDSADPIASGMVDRPALIAESAQLPAWMRVQPFTGDHAIRSALIVPLLVEGKLVGTFNVASFTPACYTERSLAMAVAFAARLTQALHNARLYAREQERARAAEELVRLRNDFVATVSHELRTPLTAIVGFGELLQAHWAHYSETRRLERIGQIVRAARRQAQLVDNLLLLSRMGTSSVAVTPVALSVAQLVRQAVVEVQGSYPDQRISVAGLADAQVWADTDRAVQVLVNLLDNAAKYSPVGSPIAVTWDQEQGLVAVRVLDHGPGIALADRSQLFTRFGRVAGSRTRAGHVGTGLGLYLSRRLVQEMGGELALERTAPEGNTFCLRLPAMPVHGDASTLNGQLGSRAEGGCAAPFRAPAIRSA